jgi:hypothetical protein
MTRLRIVRGRFGFNWYLDENAKLHRYLRQRSATDAGQAQLDL